MQEIVLNFLDDTIVGWYSSLLSSLYHHNSNNMVHNNNNIENENIKTENTIENDNKHAGKKLLSLFQIRIFVDFIFHMKNSKERSSLVESK